MTKKRNQTSHLTLGYIYIYIHIFFCVNKDDIEKSCYHLFGQCI